MQHTSDDEVKETNYGPIKYIEYLEHEFFSISDKVKPNKRKNSKVKNKNKQHANVKNENDFISQFIEKKLNEKLVKPSKEVNIENEKIVERPKFRVLRPQNNFNQRNFSINSDEIRKKSQFRRKSKNSPNAIRSTQSIHYNNSTIGHLSSMFSLARQAKDKLSVKDSLARRSTDTVSKFNEIFYKNTAKAWEEFKLGNYDAEPEFKTFRFEELDQYYEIPESGRSTPHHNIPYINETKIENDTICALCKEIKNEITYPCRVCTKVFHVRCLENKNLIKNELERDLVLQAFSNIGWSCARCADLSLLMPPQAIIELMEKFEFSDAAVDGGISEEEFIRMRQSEFSKQFYAEMSEDDVDAAKLRFKLIDADKSGFIDWDEYLNYECMKKLSNRPDRELVLELSPKEIQRARETFFCFDRDKGGTISEEEARRSYRHWFGLLLLKHDYLPNVDAHVNQQTKLLMEAARKKGGEISWEDYLQSQAIYILASRPNNPLGLIKKINATESLIDMKKSSSAKLGLPKEKKFITISESHENIDRNDHKKNKSFKFNPLHKEKLYCVN